METSVKTRRLAIGGMTCANCQEKIQRKLKNTAGVLSCEVSFAKGCADVAYDNDVVSLAEISAIIEKLGYDAPLGKAAAKPDPARAALLLGAVVLGYAALEWLGLLNALVPSRLAESGMGYGMLFAIGLATSVHCIAMCGGVNLSQTVPKDGLGGAAKAPFAPALLYNLGRVASYTLIGFAMGLIGKLAGEGAGGGLSPFWQGAAKILAGIAMAVMGVGMLGLFPALRRFMPRMPRALTRRFGDRARKAGPFLVGALNGLMPCGPLQSMQIVALASASPAAGAASMLAFSLGTAPLMLGLGSLAAAIGKKNMRAATSAGSVLVAILGLAMVSQGASLSGLFPSEMVLPAALALFAFGTVCSAPFPTKRGKAAAAAGALAVCALAAAAIGPWRAKAGEGLPQGSSSSVEGGVQYVESVLEAGSRYPSIDVEAGIPVKWTIHAPAGSINGCNGRMLISAYGIEHAFAEGDNIIEFTPEKPGTVRYSCWMGMIHGSITVTGARSMEGKADAPAEGSALRAGALPAGLPAASPSACPCCGI
jgi:sulfite exporter TauE/SafE/copper chaperone CopZ